jgi:hypothetical protein
MSAVMAAQDEPPVAAGLVQEEVFVTKVLFFLQQPTLYMCVLAVTSGRT